MLERTLGPGRVRAEAAVEMDFDRVNITEERFDPENQVPRSTQSTQESSRSAEPGNVSVANNLPAADGAGGGPTTQESRQEETTNFEIGRSLRNIVREHPQLKRLSVAVLVDGVWEPQPEGAPRFRERTPEELARLAALVRSAVGFDERRGDRVEVVSLRFAEADAGGAPGGGLLGFEIGPAMLMRLLESGILAAVALLAILLVGRPMAARFAASLAPRPQLASASPGAPALTGAAGGGTALPGPAGGAAFAAGAGNAALPAAEAEDDTMVSLAMVAGQMRASSLNRLAALVEQHPDGALTVVRRWLTPEHG
jgi:flagellar M-ring protein FliF